jgi:hypothetical protein
MSGSGKNDEPTYHTLSLPITRLLLLPLLFLSALPAGNDKETKALNERASSFCSQVMDLLPDAAGRADLRRILFTSCAAGYLAGWIQHGKAPSVPR